MTTPPHDLIGIGVGPFNLSLAAFADQVPTLRTLFLESRAEFRWHPGLLLDGARMQVPFLADLVSLVDPGNPWSFLSYLRAHDRLFPFYFSERTHLSRREYDHYCRWVASQLPACQFSSTVTALHWDPEQELFTVTYDHPSGTSRATARDVVLGVGTEPALPEAFTPVLGDRAFHASEYRQHRDALATARDITVVGSGQSGAEVFLDLLRGHTDTAGPALGADAGTGTRLRWLTRTPAFAPMEYSKLGLEQFTPDYAAYFHALPEQVRDDLLPTQWQLYKAASAETLAAVHDMLYERTVGGVSAPVELLPDTAVTSTRRTADGVELRCRHGRTGQVSTVHTDYVLLATGYAHHLPEPLTPMLDLLEWDSHGRYRVDQQHRLHTADSVTGRVYVQNAEPHTHGVGTPDLGLGAHRAAAILNDLTGRCLHRLPRRTAFTTFSPTAPATSEASGNGDGADRGAESSRAPSPRRKESDRAAASFR